MKLAAFVAAAAVCLTAFAPEASAISRLELTNATGACQGALPNFEGHLRKRPTGIVNQGTSNAFVSCSTTQNWNNPAPAEIFGVVLTNTTGAPLTVDCTLSAGVNYIGFMAPTLFPKSFEVPAGETEEFQWNAEDDNGGMAFPASLNVSCNLPAGAELGSVYYHIAEDGTAPVVVP